MNLILISIPNDIYNSVNSRQTLREMWLRVERLMQGTTLIVVDMETPFNNKFDQFIPEPGGSLVIARRSYNVQEESDESSNVQKETTDFVIVNYESDPRVPLILGKYFLRTARALIDVHGEEMILRDDDERLTLNMRHDTSSYSNQPQKELINLINIFNVSSEDFLEFDIESNLKEIEFLLYQDKDSSLKDSIDQKGLANLDAIFVDPIPEMFTDEHNLDYSSPPKFDAYDDDFLEVESDAENVYDDPFDSKGEKIKESKLLIDELDLPCDFLPPSEYDSFISQDFSRNPQLNEFFG
nr:reverse transcriptase domain-containing protein [Tanacetum cinerariifolium]